MAVETTTVRPAPAFGWPTITWSGVFAGVFVAVALDALFAVLGGAVGATAFNPYALGAGQLKAITIGEGVWLLVSNLIAFFIGGYVGARASSSLGRTHGMLQGLTVWAVGLVVSIFLANATVSGGIGGALTVAANSGAGSNAISNGAGALAGVNPTYAAQVAQAAAEALAWWTFAAIVLGIIGALIGGSLGADQLSRQEFETAP
jgi:hypothetical protein